MSASRGSRMLRMTQRQVDDWNITNPWPLRVKYLNNEGEWVETTTRSHAWLLGHGQPVVLLVGKSGGWGLDRVKVLPPPPAPAQGSSTEEGAPR